MTTPPRLPPDTPQLARLLHAYRHYAKEARLMPSNPNTRRNLDQARAAYQAALAVTPEGKRKP